MILFSEINYQQAGLYGKRYNFQIYDYIVGGVIPYLYYVLI